MPNPIAKAIAAWPPLALLLTVELISRVPVHRRSLAALRLIATAAIAGIAAWVSYWHMVGVAGRYGEDGAAPYLIPVSVDGLVVVASVSLVELAGRIRAVGFTPPERPSTPVIPAPFGPLSGEVMPAIRGVDPDSPADALSPSEARRKERLTRQARAMAALVDPDADPAEIAQAAGISVDTLHRWADSVATAARRPRGRKPERDLVDQGATR